MIILKSKRLIFVELHVVVKKIYLLLESCRNKKWCEVTIFQIKNKESFRKILLDLILYCNAISDVLKMHYLKEFEGIVWIMCNVDMYDKVKGDDISFYEKLIDGSQNAYFEE